MRGDDYDTEGLLGDNNLTREEQERRDAEYAAALYEQDHRPRSSRSTWDSRPYTGGGSSGSSTFHVSDNHTSGVSIPAPSSSSSGSHGRPGEDFDITAFLREEDRQRARAREAQYLAHLASTSTREHTGPIRMDAVLPDMLNAAIVLISMCATELLLVVSSVVFASILFNPMDKALIVWVELANALKCITGMFVAGFLFGILRVHLPYRTAPGPEGSPPVVLPIGIDKSTGAWRQHLYRNLDYVIVLYFTLEIISLLIFIVVLFMTVGGLQHSNPNTRMRALYVVIVSVLVLLVGCAQCACLLPLLSLLKQWPTFFRPGAEDFGAARTASAASPNQDGPREEGALPAPT